MPVISHGVGGRTRHRRGIKARWQGIFKKIFFSFSSAEGVRNSAFGVSQGLQSALPTGEWGCKLVLNHPFFPPL